MAMQSEYANKYNLAICESFEGEHEKAGIRGNYIGWPRPISVNDRLPEGIKNDDGVLSSDWVIAFSPVVGGWVSGFISNGIWMLDGERSRRPQNVTHWLPAPPKPE